MYKFILKPIIILILILTITSCSKKDNDDNKLAKSTIVYGNVQKGPFLKDSTISICKIDEKLECLNDKIVTTKVTDNQGSYSFKKLSWNGPSKITIDGYYFDEITGKNSTKKAIINAIIIIKSKTKNIKNINIITQAQSKLMKKLVDENKSIDDAFSESKNNLKVLFDIDVEEFTELDLTDFSSGKVSVNAALLRISAAISKSKNPIKDLNRLMELFNKGGLSAVLKSDLYIKLMNDAHNIDIKSLMATLNINSDIIDQVDTKKVKLPVSAKIHLNTFDSNMDKIILNLYGTEFITSNPNINIITKPSNLLSITNQTISDDNKSIILDINKSASCRSIDVKITIDFMGLKEVVSPLTTNTIDFKNPFVICATTDVDNNPDTSTPINRPQNKPPVAIIGMDFEDSSEQNITAYIGATVNGLETYYSYDQDDYPFGGIKYCKWEYNGEIIKEENNANCDLYDLKFDTAGVYEYILTVIDTDDDIDTNKATITIQENHLPIITLNPNENISVNVNELVEINASVSDEDGDSLSYMWFVKRKDSSSSSSNGNTLNFTKTFSNAGEYIVSINVTDSKGARVTKSINVTINDSSDMPPIAKINQNANIVNQEIYAQRKPSVWAGGNDDNGIVYCKWTNPNGSILMENNIKSTTFIDEYMCPFDPSILTEAGNYIYTLTVKDTIGQEDTNELNVTVLANSAPIVDIGDNQNIKVNQELSITATISDPDDDNMTKQWFYGIKDAGTMWAAGTSLTFTHTFTSSGIYLVQYDVRDEHQVKTVKTIEVNVSEELEPTKFTFNDKIGVEIQQWFDSTITVDWLEQNESKTITSSGYIGQNVHFGFKVNGIAGESGVTTVSNGDLVTVWHKSSNNYNTTLDTTITIGDYNDTFSTTTKLDSHTKLPLIVGSPNMSGRVNEYYSYIPQLSINYDNYAPATKPFTIENKPLWADFNESTGELSGTPTAIGIYKNVRITAYGDNGLDDITFDLSISNDAPYISGYNHSLDNDNLMFTFNDNTDWRSKITSVEIYNCYSQTTPILLDSNDYTFTQGELKLHTSTSTNAALRVPIIGGGRLIIKAEQYNDREVLIDYIQDGIYGVKATSIAFVDNNPITEDNLNGARINIFLSNNLKFADDTLDKNNFSFYESPTGLSISEVAYINDTTAQITLAYNGTDFDENKTIKLNISPSELNICQDVTTNTLNVEAVIEPQWKNLLYPNDPAINGKFGASVDINNNTIVASSESGTYIYKKDNLGNYQQTQKISGAKADDLALYGDYLVIGNGNFWVDGNGLEGKVEIYKKDSNGVYNFLQEISKPTLSDSAHFGKSVDISGDLLIIGAYNDDNHKGAAYLYKNNGNDDFTLQETIKRVDGKAQDNFGIDVAIDGNYFIVGSMVMSDLTASPIDNKPELGAGFANYYSYIDNSLSLISYITPDDSSSLADNFGQSVSISGYYIAIGASGNNHKGSVYLYKRVSNAINENGKIEGEIQDEGFGSSVGIYHDTSNKIVVGTSVYGNAYSVTQNATSFTKYKSTLEGNTTIDGSDRLGYRVCIYEDEVAFSVFKNDDKGKDAGAVLVTNIKESITADINDTTPNQFRFEDEVDVELNTQVSKSITITGINKPSSISVNGGEYSLDGKESWHINSLTLENNQIVWLRVMSSSSYNTTSSATLTVGGISDTFNSTTIQEPTPEITNSYSINSFNLDFDYINHSYDENQNYYDAITAIYYKAGENASYELLTLNDDYNLTNSTFTLYLRDAKNVALHTPYASGGKIKFVATNYADNILTIDSMANGTYGIKATLNPHNDDNPLREDRLDGFRIYIELDNNLEFADNTLETTNFSLSNAPTGTTISEISYVDNIKAMITLSFDGTDFDENATLSVTINQSELNSYISVISNSITVEAIIEEEEVPTQGQVYDPYIVNARFWYDVNGDTQEDPNELSTYSDENGTFEFDFQLPEGALVKMVEKGLHNGKPFNGDLKGEFSVQADAHIVSPITSLTTGGFSGLELINILSNAGLNDLELVSELLIDPFDTSLLPLDGNMSTYTSAQIAKFKRILLANIVINAVVSTRVDGYSLSKDDINTILTKEYSAGGEGEGEGSETQAPTSITKKIIDIGNTVLTEDNLRNTNARVMARIFVSSATYTSDILKQNIIENNGDDTLFWIIRDLSYDMIAPLKDAYIKGLKLGIIDPKIEWVKVNSKYRPMLMIDNNDLGKSEDITIIYNDGDSDIKVKFSLINHDYYENDNKQGQWQINGIKVNANSKEFQLQGNKIVVNTVSYDIKDVIYGNENFYEELPSFISSNIKDMEKYVDINSTLTYTLSTSLTQTLQNALTCSINMSNPSVPIPFTIHFDQNKFTLIPNDLLNRSKKYHVYCSISYGEDTLYIPTINFISEVQNLPIMKTGQTTCYDDRNGNTTIVCSDEHALADDGYWEKGEEINRDHTSNHVNDSVANLQYTDDGNSTKSDQVHASMKCSALELDGYDNWRLPTVNELMSLARYDGNTTHIVGFENLSFSDFYWTSTRVIDSTVYASDEYMRIKFPNTLENANEGLASRSMCVRNIQSRPTIYPDLIKNISVVKDAKNNLEWTDLTNGENNTSTPRTWVEAVNYCKNVQFDGKTDWRLPNINELLTTAGHNKELLDGRNENSLNDVFTSTHYSESFWSSTTYKDDASKAYTLYGLYGKLYLSDKTGNHKARCVRDNE